jgi:hypothetical protein
MDVLVRLIHVLHLFFACEVARSILICFLWTDDVYFENFHDRSIETPIRSCH